MVGPFVVRRPVSERLTDRQRHKRLMASVQEALTHRGTHQAATKTRTGRLTDRHQSDASRTAHGAGVIGSGVGQVSRRFRRRKKRRSVHRLLALK